MKQIPELKKIIIFTDLDGTLLDATTYSFDPAVPALYLLKENDIPLVICSSKTRKEIEYYRQRLNNNHPFISENGGGIFIPKGYFRFNIADCRFKIEKNKDYRIIRLGAKYSDLRKAIRELREEGFDIKGFGDMAVEEITELTNISTDEAEMAKERDFDEPFIFVGAIHELPLLFDSIKSKGFNFTQGGFFHILGNSDKGKAVSILTGLYRKRFGEVITIALGDSPNDIPMLEKADRPVVVQRPDSSYHPDIEVPNLIRAEGIGPEGWNRTVMALLQTSCPPHSPSQ